MSDAELADAVRLPAAGVGVEIEPRLVDRVTAEAAVQPGALPLVQHTMVELFAQRQSNVIKLAAFESPPSRRPAASPAPSAAGPKRSTAVSMTFDVRRPAGSSFALSTSAKTTRTLAGGSV
jgi:hypothetical protein